MLEPRLKVTQDIVFHYLFSSPGAEEGLLGFVNAVQESVGKPLAKNVTIQSPFNLQNYVGDKQTVLDVRATDSENREYDVEIQVCDQDYFLERTLYYWARMYSSALTSGEEYEKLHPVVAIILTKFEVCTELYDLHNEFCICAKKNPSVILTDHFQYHLLEMTQKRWNRHLELFSTDSKSNEILRQKSLFNWIKFILHADTQTEDEMTKLIEMTPGLGTAYNKYQEFNSDPTMREYALAREKTERDHLGQLNTAHRRGYAEGEVAGELKAKRNNVLITLDLLYPAQITPSVRNRIFEITDCELLDNLHRSAILRTPFEELVKMF